jgi:hypothetical protein
LVCRLAGKPLVVDGFKLKMLWTKGLATQDEIYAKLQERGIRFIVVDKRAAVSSLNRALAINR